MTSVPKYGFISAHAHQTGAGAFLLISAASRLGGAPEGQIPPNGGSQVGCHSADASLCHQRAAGRPSRALFPVRTSRRQSARFGPALSPLWSRLGTSISGGLHVWCQKSEGVVRKPNRLKLIEFIKTYLPLLKSQTQALQAVFHFLFLGEQKIAKSFKTRPELDNP